MKKNQQQLNVYKNITSEQISNIEVKIGISIKFII